MALPVTLGGSTVAFETSEVRPQVSGIIRQRLFTEGGCARRPAALPDRPEPVPGRVNQAQANLASAQASAEAAQAKADRYKPLADMEAVAKQDYTDALAAAPGGPGGRRRSRRAALETARINLRFTTVPAPITGRIGRSLFTVGALVTASQTDPLAVIQRLDPIYVDIQQSTADLTALRRSWRSGGVGAGSTEVRLKLRTAAIIAWPARSSSPK